MIYVILGETASGKTDIALKLCDSTNIPLISSDAYSVYEGFDIGSSKPKKEELENVERYFISSKKFGDEMTVYEFQKEGRKLLDKFLKEGKDVIIAGGTFLYIRALLFPYEFTDYDKEKMDRNIPYEEAKQKLIELAPNISNYVDLNNPRRVIAALNSILNGNSLEQNITNFVNNPLYPCIFIKIKTNPDEINERITKRVYQMVEEGLFDETRKLIELNPIFSKSFKGIGFKEIYEGLSNNESEDEIISRIIFDTKKYAKRQRTFLRHQFSFYIEMDREEIVPTVLKDIERRKDSNMKKEEQSLPLIPRLAVEYIPAIDFLYNQGVTTIAVFSIDKGLVEDFVYKVHINSPLMQILVFDQTDFDNPKLPKMSYVLPYLPSIRNDDLLDKFIKEKKIPKKIPQDLDKFLKKGI